VTNLATERAEEAKNGVIVRRDGVDFGVVDETRLTERVQTRQAFRFVVRQLTDLTHQQIRTQLRRFTLRHRSDVQRTIYLRSVHDQANRFISNSKAVV